MLLLAALLPVACAASWYEEVRAAVFADPYTTLPRYRVERARFGTGGDVSGNHLYQAARRTLTQPGDLLEFETGQKLFQPNGICFDGRWEMDAGSPYTGSLGADTSVPAIVRASVMLDGTRRADKRAFGLAVKLFVPADAEPRRTVNLLVMESMGGRYLDHVTEAVLDNEPRLGGLPPWRSLATVLRIRRDLERARRDTGDPRPSIRYQPIAGLAATPKGAGATTRAPHWLRLRVSPGTVAVEADDFRDELNLAGYPGGRLTYLVEAAEAAPRKREARWMRLGRLTLLASVVSATCDRRLHFSHAAHGAAR